MPVGRQGLLNLGVDRVVFKAPLNKYYMAGSNSSNNILAYYCYYFEPWKGSLPFAFAFGPDPGLKAFL